MAQVVGLGALEADAGLGDDSVVAVFDSAAGFDSVEGLPSAEEAAAESAAGFSAELDALLLGA